MVRARQSRNNRPVRDSGNASKDLNHPPRNDRNNRVGDNAPSPGGSRGTPGAPHDRRQAAGPTASGEPGGNGPDLSRMCARDNPYRREHPCASFVCVTCERDFCELCRGDDGDCCNCQFLKMKCWACRRNALEVSMYSCHDCDKNICNEHTYRGEDCFERCSRCHAAHERANRGAPPPPPGDGGGHGGPSGRGGGSGHGSSPRPPPGLGLPAKDKDPLDHLVVRGGGGAPSGGYPGGGGAPAFSGVAVDSHGIGNNQCGSSFYGPAYGGGVSHYGVGAGVSQPNTAAGYPSSVASGGNLGPGLSPGYSVNGAVRQGDGGLLPEALRLALAVE